MIAVGLIAAMLAAGGLFIWMGWEKLAKRFKGAEKIKALLLRTDPVVEQLNLLIDSDTYLVDHKTGKGWLLYDGAIQRSQNDTVAGVLLTNESCIPQFPGVAKTEEEKKKETEKICEWLEKNDPNLCHDRAMGAIEKQQREAVNTATAEWMGLAMTIAVGGVMIMAIVILLTSGLMPWSK